MIIKGTGGLGNKRTVGDHPNYSLIEIDQNTEKSPGDLRRLAVTQTSTNDYQLTLIWKTLKEYNNNNITNSFQKQEKLHAWNEEFQRKERCSTVDSNFPDTLKNITA